MDNITIIEVTTKKQLNAFFKFPYILFKNDKMWVPQLLMDEKVTFNKAKNPALEFCDHKIWLAYRDGKIVGRIVGIINNKANQIWQRNRVRFGWFDFINSDQVAKALLDAVVQWGKSRGMNKIFGPMGFTDMDKEGMMVEGFDVDCPMACYYNPSYYPAIMNSIGYEKEVDWVQYQIVADQPVPEKVQRVNEMIKNRYNLRIVDNISAKQIANLYGEKIFLTLNKAFSSLYGFVPLNEKQIKFYIKQYFSFLDKRLICFIVDEKDDVVAFGVSMPSLSDALRKGRGKLFPFGWLYLLRALRNFEKIDLYLNGVAPEWQNKGVHSLYYAEMNKRNIELKVKTAIANPQLEDNQAAHIWEKYNSHVAIRRRAYVKEIN